MEYEMTLLNEIRLLNIAVHRGFHVGCGETHRVSGMILHYVYRCGGRASQKDIEKAFDLRRSTVSETLRRLEQEGYITRETGDTDGRVKYIVLSDKANAEQNAIAEKFAAFERKLRAAFTEDETNEFVRLCEKLRSQISSIVSEKE